MPLYSTYVYLIIISIPDYAKSIAVDHVAAVQKNELQINQMLLDFNSPYFSFCGDRAILSSQTARATCVIGRP